MLCIVQFPKQYQNPDEEGKADVLNIDINDLAVRQPKATHCMPRPQSNEGPPTMSYLHPSQYYPDHWSRKAHRSGILSYLQLARENLCATWTPSQGTAPGESCKILPIPPVLNLGSAIPVSLLKLNCSMKRRYSYWLIQL